MKSYAIPGLILALLLALCLCSSVWLTRRCDSWTDQLQQIDRCARADDWEEAEALLETLYGDWLQVQLWLHVTMEHEELDAAEALFCRARVLAEEEDSVEFRAHIADLLSQLQLLAELEQIRLENVL